jgi:hypothetical protein
MGTLAGKARQIAATKNLAMDGPAAIALTPSRSRLVANPCLEGRAARSTGTGLKAFLAWVPEVEPPERVHLPRGFQPKT